MRALRSGGVQSLISNMSQSSGTLYLGTESSSSNVDALGSTAYYDNATNTAETISGCHRSKAAEVFIGGVVSANLACSGARTFTQTGSSFKPGIDFYDSGTGQQGQAKMLQTYAATHNVKMVVLSIGGNNFNFADIVQTCVSDWLLSSSLFPDYCNDDSSVTANFTSANITAQTTAIKNAILNLRTLKPFIVWTVIGLLYYLMARLIAAACARAAAGRASATADAPVATRKRRRSDEKRVFIVAFPLPPAATRPRREWGQESARRRASPHVRGRSPPVRCSALLPRRECGRAAPASCAG